MNAQLEVVVGPDKGRVFLLTPEETLVVGRGQSSNTWLSDPFVSRVHFVVQHSAGKFVVMDAGSSSGITVNGEKVSHHDLVEGDVIAIGETELRFGPEPSPDDTGVRPQMAEPTVESGRKMEGLIGRKFHNYRIKKVLAKGRSGVVFGAEDEVKKRLVALKVLWPELAQFEEETQRFIRAMKTVLNIRHENLVRVYGAGKTGASVWTAMEYVPGISMTEVIEQIGIAGMLDWKYAFRVTVHIARGLEVAHSHDIIHRNITPRNILLRSSDKVAKLGDLMLAKALSGTLAESITRPGQLIGELAYMSPETTMATEEHEIDQRSDIYNLGATAYALLTGRPPFEGSNLVETIQMIRTVVPESPSVFQMSIQAQFEAVVMRMLAKDPAHRFPNARELLAELEKVRQFHHVDV